MGPVSSPETSVSNHLTPHNNPDNGKIQFKRRGSLRSRNNSVDLLGKVKIKAKGPLDAIESYEKVEVWLRSFLISAPDESEWSASHCGHFGNEIIILPLSGMQKTFLGRPSRIAVTVRANGTKHATSQTWVYSVLPNRYLNRQRQIPSQSCPLSPCRPTGRSATSGNLNSVQNKTQQQDSDYVQRGGFEKGD